MQGRARFDHIHALRGVAALIVVVQHACQMTLEAGSPLFRDMLAGFNFGRFGVLTFFLISGFVVPFSFRGDRPLRDFALSRLFRLYPAYWLSLPILALVAAHIGLPHDAATVIANISMVQAFGGYGDIGPGYWTLRFELLFYGVCALLYWRNMLADPMVVGPVALGALIVAIAPAVAGAGRGGTLPVMEPAFYVALFFTGLLLRLAWVDRSVAARRWATIVVPLAMVDGLILGGAFVPVAANANIFFPPMALSLAMALPVPLFLLLLWLKPVPGRTAMYLGTVSYSVYLFQDVGLHLLPHLVSPATAPLTYVAMVLAVTVLIASAVYRWIERPMIAAGRRHAETPARTALTNATA